MEVLTVFLEEDREKAENYKKELTDLGVLCIDYLIPRKWTESSLKHICEKSYILMINNSRLAEEEWFLYLSGYLLGSDGSGILAGQGVPRGAPGTLNWKFLKDPSSARKFYRMEKNNWDQKEEIRLAGEELLNRGYNLNEDSMVFSVIEGDVEAVRLFLTAGFSSEGRDGRGTPILSIAASRGHVEIMDILLMHGAEVDRFSKDRHNTALMDASAEGRTEAVRMLLDAGAGIEYKSKNGQTALILSVGQRHIEAARLLLEHGANPEEKDALGMSGAGYARLFKLEALETLMKGGEGGGN